MDALADALQDALSLDGQAIEFLQPFPGEVNVFTDPPPTVETVDTPPSFPVMNWATIVRIGPNTNVRLKPVGMHLALQMQGPVPDGIPLPTFCPIPPGDKIVRVRGAAMRMNATMYGEWDLIFVFESGEEREMINTGVESMAATGEWSMNMYRFDVSIPDDNVLYEVTTAISGAFISLANTPMYLRISPETASGLPDEAKENLLLCMLALNRLFPDENDVKWHILGMIRGYDLIAAEVEKRAAGEDPPTFTEIIAEGEDAGADDGTIEQQEEGQEHEEFVQPTETGVDDEEGIEVVHTEEQG